MATEISKKQKDFIDSLLNQIKDGEIKKKFEEESKNLKTSADASNLIDKLKYEVSRQKLIEKKEEIKKETETKEESKKVESKEEDFKLNPNPQLALLEDKLISVAQDLGYEHCWTNTNKGQNGVALEIKFRKPYKKQEQ
jgi:alpha-glucosidase (family GH31 glycosyl hydrolase)